MDVVALLAVFVALAAVVAIVSAPLRAARGKEAEGAADRAVADRIAELEARKEAKYREIRDAEMDLRTGKLSVEDHRVLDRQLRAEAIEVLHALDEADDR